MFESLAAALVLVAPSFPDAMAAREGHSWNTALRGDENIRQNRHSFFWHPVVLAEALNEAHDGSANAAMPRACSVRDTKQLALIAAVEVTTTSEADMLPASEPC